MKFIRKLIPLFALPFLVTSCASVAYDFTQENYVIEMNYEDCNNILQIADTHLGLETDLNKEFTYYDNLIKNSYPQINYIVFMGDIFEGANKTIVKQFFNFFDSYDIPFSFIYGETDLQEKYGYQYIDQVIKACDNSIYVGLDNDVLGLGNYVINLFNGGDLVFQYYFFNSNSYTYNGGYELCGLTQSQINWYTIMNELTKEKYGEYSRQTIFSHLPLYEVKEASEEYKQGLIFGIGEDNETPITQKENTLFDIIDDMTFKFIDQNLVEHIVHYMMCYLSAHNHMNYSCIQYHDMFFGSAIKTGDSSTYNKDHIGASVFNLNESYNFSYTFNFFSYDEVEL